MTRISNPMALRIFLTFAFAMAPFCFQLLAQPVGGPPPCWPPPCIPIDGGISALLAAGLAYGGHRALKLRKANANN
jgi:hypothetical protein